MITLFHRPKTRSARFFWLFEELAAPYQVKEVTGRSAGGGGAPDPANPHPHGKVPAISDDGVVIFESPAIALYLTDKFPKAGIGPVIGDPKRGTYLSWLVYYGSVFEPALMSKFMNVAVPGPAGWAEIEQVIEFVVKTLSAGPYLLGEKFSAADILYSTTFAMFGPSPVMPKSPVIDSYVKRCTERPAYARAMAKEGV